MFFTRDLCINRNNHQKPTFHPLGDFLNPALALLGQGLKKSQLVNKVLCLSPYSLCQHQITTQPLLSFGKQNKEDHQKKWLRNYGICKNFFNNPSVKVVVKRYFDMFLRFVVLFVFIIAVGLIF
jgi:hypothetical protein